MATVSAEFSTGEVSLSTTVADRVTLSAKGSHKVRIDNLTGAEPLYVNIAGYGSMEAAVRAQGTLTLDTQPTDETIAQGTLTVDTAVTDGDTFTIDTVTYTLQSTLTDAANNIAIGGSLAQTKLNIVAAINLTGVPGTDYGSDTAIHPTVSAAAFSADNCVLSAKTAGAAGDTIVTTETFTAITNVFDATTLGATTAGVDADTMTIGSRTYTFKDTLDNAVADQIQIGANLAATKASLEKLLDVSGTDAVDYSTPTLAHNSVDIGSFTGNDAVLTAKEFGVGGNSIATTETFTAGTNVFDDTTLGTTTAGADSYPSTATAAADHIVVGPGLTVELLSKAYGVDQNGFDASIVGSGNDYAVQLIS